MPKNQNKVSTLKVILFILTCTFIGFGGGNALLPIIKKYAVNKYGWITEREFDDAVIAANLFPGPTSVKTLSYVSMKTLGSFKGAVVAILAFLPHTVISLLIFVLLQKYAQNYLYVITAAVLPVIIGVLLNFGYNYVKKSHNEISYKIWIPLFIFSFSFYLLVPSPYNVPVIPIIITLIGIVIFVCIKNKKIIATTSKDSKEGKE
ncbi:chromate transporter [Mycoplasma phocoenae]|uniref:Chromate transporter n=1 Tax=Mycoplasma phocoenae TaxID=754517 RepID=A0A858U6L5_9MOLU|nr:chromate transporter [Mycoplasma phocoenae]QJG66905.1 chromate transporter [Mycoplasma phocoenae]